jgi:hypothetical protein
MNIDFRQWMSPAGAIAALGGLLAVGALVAWWKYKDSGPLQIGQDIGHGIADAAGGLASGFLGGVSEAVGIARPDQTISDVEQVRQIIGQQGFFAASKQATATAFFKASFAGPAYYGNEGARTSPLLLMNTGSPDVLDATTDPTSVP